MLNPHNHQSPHTYFYHKIREKHTLYQISEPQFFPELLKNNTDYQVVTYDNFKSFQLADYQAFTNRTL